MTCLLSCALLLFAWTSSADALCVGRGCGSDFRAPPAHCADPRAFGAKGDGKADDGPAIQRALDDASDCTLLQEGTYLSSDVFVPSHTTFFLLRAVLAASTGVGGVTTLSLVNAKDVVNATVEGLDAASELQGNSNDCIASFSVVYDRYEPCAGARPHLIYATRTDGLTVRNMNLRNASNWNIQLDGTNNTLVEKTSVHGDWRYPNNDGIDPQSGTNITIRDCDVNVADDGICPKAALSLGPLLNLTVRRVRIRSKSHAIKFGSNTDTEMAHMLFDDIEIHDSNSGISVQQRSDGLIHDIQVPREDRERETGGMGGGADRQTETLTDRQTDRQTERLALIDRQRH